MASIGHYCKSQSIPNTFREDENATHNIRHPTGELMALWLSKALQHYFSKPKSMPSESPS